MLPFLKVMKKKDLPKDEEAYNEWKKWIAEDRILMGIKKIISGKWVIQVPAVPAPKYMLIAELMKKERRRMERHW